MEEEIQELDNLVASHEVVMSGYWNTVREKLFQKMEEKTSLLDVDDSLKPEDMVIHIRASKMAVAWVEDWINEIESDAAEFVLDKNNNSSDYISIH